MKNDHSCKTYVSVGLKFDSDKNVELLRRGARHCEPEDIGIYNRDDVGRALEVLTSDLTWRRHWFEIGVNGDYDVDVNNMIRITLKDLIGKEETIKSIADNFDVDFCLHVVPYIVRDSDEPSQILSLDDDIIAFLHESGVSFDLDYYIL